MNDDDFMKIAIEESKKGDWPYGAVLVKNGKVIAKAFNTTTRDKDTTAHAEVNLIRKALKTMPEASSLEGYTLYTSSESCPMCASAEIWAGVSRVVHGASIQQLIEIGQPQIDISAQNIINKGFVTMELKGGVLANEALTVIKQWKPPASL